MLTAHTLYGPAAADHRTPLTPLITVAHIRIPNRAQPIFLLHMLGSGTPYNLGRMYKAIAAITHYTKPTAKPIPIATPPETTLQQILTLELSDPLFHTTIIAPLLSSALYNHLHTHCTLNKPLWYTDNPGPWYSPHALHAGIGAVTGATSTLLQGNITLVHAEATRKIPGSLRTVTQDVSSYIDAFQLNPPPIRVVVISSPAMATDILILAAARFPVGAHANTILTLPAHTVEIQAHNWGALPARCTTNAMPLAITILESEGAPPFDLASLLHDLQNITASNTSHTTLDRPPPTSHPPHHNGNFPHLPFIIPGPRLTLPALTQPHAPPPAPYYGPEDQLLTLATLMGAHPDKHITRYLKQAGQHTGNSEDERERLQRILTVIKDTTANAHARLYAWHCAEKYGTQQKHRDL